MPSEDGRPSVDVLVVSYNTEDVLRACLESIEEHRPPGIDLRMSVLDNASRDGSAEMVASSFPGVRLVRWSENRGFGPANNHLAETSDADYLLLLNSDTLWTEDIVTPLRQLLEEVPRAVITAPRLLWPDGRTQPSAQAFPRLSLLAAIILDNLGVDLPLGRGRSISDVVQRAHQLHLTEQREPREVDWAWATCWLLRRADVARDGLFDPRYAMYDEDADFCIRARKRGRTVVYHAGVKLVHIGEASSRPRERQDRMWVARHRLYRDHHGRAAAAIYRSVIAAGRAVRTVNERRAR